MKVHVWCKTCCTFAKHIGSTLPPVAYLRSGNGQLEVDTSEYACDCLNPTFKPLHPDDVLQDHIVLLELQEGR